MHNHLTVFLFLCNAAGFSAMLSKSNMEPKLISKSIQVEASFKYFNVEYEAILSFGTPAQVFTVIVDPSSEMLWIPHKNATNRELANESCLLDESYDETKSSSVQITNEHFETKLSGWVTKGNYVKDVFAFGNGSDSNSLIKLNKPVVFGVADSMFCGDRGIWGLSLSSYNNSVLEQAVDQGLIEHPMFTVFLKTCPPNLEKCNGGGMITFGKHDLKNCGAVIGTTEPINSDNQLWKFFIDEAAFGKYTHAKRVSAIIDIRSSYLTLGPALFDNIIKETGAVQVFPGSEMYKVQCNKNIKLKFKINEIDYAVPLNESFVVLPNNECQLQIYRNNDEDSMWVLGAPFMRSWCQVYDFKNRVVAFAKPGQNQPGEEYTPETFGITPISEDLTTRIPDANELTRTVPEDLNTTPDANELTRTVPDVDDLNTRPATEEPITKKPIRKQPQRKRPHKRRPRRNRNNRRKHG